MGVLILYDRNAINDNGVNRLSWLLDVIDKNKDIQAIELNREKFKPCTGCFGCWLKTPGSCVITKDEANKISKKFVQADILVLLTCVTYGGYSSDTKAYLDRFIGNISPFFMIKNHEMHHQKRYVAYPDLVTIGYGDMTEEETATFIELTKRNAINMHSKRYASFTVRNQKEALETASDLQKFLRKEPVSI